jgi:aryl-phospho-beta-D-glucosidase BglC (GH1 family)
MKEMKNSGRREFIKTSGMVIGALGLTGTLNCTSTGSVTKNKLPKWKGFNVLDYFSPNPNRAREGTKEEFFKWMSDWGFDFIRIPMAYPSYIQFDRSRNITPEEVYQIDDEAIEKIDQVVSYGHKYNMHVSLNLHRAPGFCVNAGFHEPSSIITGLCGLKDTKTCHLIKSALI